MHAKIVDGRRDHKPVGAMIGTLFGARQRCADGALDRFRIAHQATHDRAIRDRLSFDDADATSTLIVRRDQGDPRERGLDVDAGAKTYAFLRRGRHVT